MSSYLVAFVVGNLTSIQREVDGGLDPGTSHLVRVWGTPDRCESFLMAQSKFNMVSFTRWVAAIQSNWKVGRESGAHIALLRYS